MSASYLSSERKVAEDDGGDARGIGFVLPAVVGFLLGFEIGEGFVDCGLGELGGVGGFGGGCGGGEGGGERDEGCEQENSCGDFHLGSVIFVLGNRSGEWGGVGSVRFARKRLGCRNFWDFFDRPHPHPLPVYRERGSILRIGSGSKLAWAEVFGMMLGVWRV